MIGKKIWIFADGDLPPKGESAPFGHEAVSIINPNQEAANTKITVYYPDKEPVRDIPKKVEAERVDCFHLEEEWGDGPTYTIVPGQYALKIESDVPVVCVFGRLDRTPNCSYYEMDGYSE